MTILAFNLNTCVYDEEFERRGYFDNVGCKRQRFLELGTRFLTVQLLAGVSRSISFCLTSDELIRTQ